jgi:hypothetical protein
MSKTDKGKKVIDSTIVQDYKPAAAIRKAFDDFDELKNYTVSVCGKQAPTFVRLPKNIYKSLCDCIETKSDKRRTIRDVYYNGLRIIGEHEAAP